MFNNSKGLLNKLFTIISSHHGHFTNVYKSLYGGRSKEHRTWSIFPSRQGRNILRESLYRLFLMF